MLWYLGPCWFWRACPSQGESIPGDSKQLPWDRREAFPLQTNHPDPTPKHLLNGALPLKATIPRPDTFEYFLWAVATRYQILVYPALPSHRSHRKSSCSHFSLGSSAFLLLLCFPMWPVCLLFLRSCEMVALVTVVSESCVLPYLIRRNPSTPKTSQARPRATCLIPLP